MPPSTSQKGRFLWPEVLTARTNLKALMDLQEMRSDRTS